MATLALSALAVLGTLGAANAAGNPGGVVYNYNLGGQDWGYAGTKPVATCLTNASSAQSPINVADQVVTFGAPLAPLNVSYGQSSSWALEVTANYLEIAEIDTITTTGTGPAGFTANSLTDGLTLPDGTFLPLNQFHFHTPSEHTINGMHYPLEMHMVHKQFRTNTSNATNPVLTASSTPGATLQRAAVIGIMFAYDPAGANGTFMNHLTAAFSMLTGDVGPAQTFTTDFNSTAYPSSTFNLQSEIFGAANAGNSKYYNYNGSLTTPGCNQGITWFLMATPLYASPAQILSFTAALAAEQGGMSRGGDNRLVQPLNNRAVLASFGGPRMVTVVATHTLGGLTAATFANVKTAFISTLAGSLSVQTSAVTVASVTENSSRRHLLAVSGVTVVTAITVPSSVAASTSSLLQANAANPTFIASLQSATGATGVTYQGSTTATSAAPSVTAVVAAAMAAVAVALAF